MDSGGRLAVMLGSNLAVGDLTRSLGRPAGGVGSETVIVNRHGTAPFVPAHRIDHAANLRALAEAGCDRLLAIGSTGTLRVDWPVGTVVVPDDFFAPWVVPSIFDDARGHAVPGFDESWRSVVVDAWTAATTLPLVDGGVYVQTLGPRFETPAEIRFYASVGDLVGMTLAAEGIVAGELGMRYAAVCVVDNLANGLAPARLTPEEHVAGVEANRRAVSAALAGVVKALEGGGR
jgi:purine nucleoside phosphorylase